MSVVELNYRVLDEIWIALIRLVLEKGQEVDSELLEVNDVLIRFQQVDKNGLILLNDRRRTLVYEMQKVFFSNEPNVFGHNYHERTVGPYGRNDLGDIVQVLAEKPFSKRATLTIFGDSNGHVPCVNIVQFLVREFQLHVTYFARGQDVYNKVYADAMCIYEMAQRVASKLDVSIGSISGLIQSAHLYLSDLPTATDTLQKHSLQ